MKPQKLDDEEEDEARPQPATRAEMQELKKKHKSNLALSCKFLADRELQLEFRIIYAGAKHLLDEYTSTLEQHKTGQDHELTPKPVWLLGL